MIVPSHNAIVGPLVALAALGVIVLMCRWVFSTDVRDDRTARRLAKARARGDFGLLVPVAAARSRDEGAALQDALRTAGVRATLAQGGDDSASHAVLVFRADAERAQDVLSSWQPPAG